MLSKDDGRFVYFEGTYTATFSGTSVKTPRYDYNQILYRLDLDDPRLNLPVAVYSDDEATFRTRRVPAKSGTIRFWALERPKKGTVPLYGQKARKEKPMFYALPADAKNPPFEKPVL